MLYNFITCIEEDIKHQQKIYGSVDEDKYVYYKLNTEKIQTQYLYLTLTNLHGNTELIVNYINQDYPTLEKADLQSSTPNDEFIIVDLKDPKFVNKRQVIIGIYGLFQSKYYLYATFHQQALYPISKKASCKAKKDGYCYFSYSDIQPNKDLDILISANYIYGRGNIYGRLHSADEDDITSKDTKKETNKDTSKDTNKDINTLNDDKNINRTIDNKNGTRILDNTMVQSHFWDSESQGYENSLKIFSKF